MYIYVDNVFHCGSRFCSLCPAWGLPVLKGNKTGWGCCISCSLGIGQFWITGTWMQRMNAARSKVIQRLQGQCR